MEFLANVLGNTTEKIVDPKATIWLLWDEPECPEELI